MRILIDTNVLIDSVMTRKPFSEYSDKVLFMCKECLLDGCISAHSVTDMFYILRKEYDQNGRKMLFEELSKFLYIVPVDFQKLRNAVVNKDFSDVEDCLQMQCAKDFCADYIVTRNIKDFKNSEIKAIMPEYLIKII